MLTIVLSYLLGAYLPAGLAFICFGVLAGLTSWVVIPYRLDEEEYEEYGYETYAEYEFDNLMAEIFKADTHARWEWDDAYRRKYAKVKHQNSLYHQIHQPDQDVKEGIQWLQDHERIATWEKAMIERDNNPDIF